MGVGEEVCQQYRCPTQNGWKKGKRIPFLFLQQWSNANWHFYSTKTSLRAGSQWFEVHEERVLSAAVSQLVATSSYYNITTIALYKYRFLKTKISEKRICSTKSAHREVKNRNKYALSAEYPSTYLHNNNICCILTRSEGRL